MDLSYLMDCLDQIQSKKGIEELALNIVTTDSDFRKLLKLVAMNNGKISERGSWLARTWASFHPAFISKHLKNILVIMEGKASDPILRNLSGIFVDHCIPPTLESRILNYSFKVLQDVKKAVAVHANALELLGQLAGKYPELEAEIGLITQDHPNAEHPSFYIRRWKAGRKSGYR